MNAKVEMKELSQRWLAVLALIAVGTAIVLTTRSLHSTSHTKNLNLPPPSVGDEVVLVSGEEDEVILGVSVSDYDQMIKASIAKDQFALAGMEPLGKALFVKNRTKALLLDSGPGRKQVRILEGNLSGRSGWVRAEEVQRPLRSRAETPMSLQR